VASIDRAISDHRAEALVSFMEPLAALHRRIGKARAALLTIGHPLRWAHPGALRADAPRAKSPTIARRAVWSSAGGLRHALTLEPVEDLPDSGWMSGPPLLEDLEASDSRSDKATESPEGWVVVLARAEQRHEVENWHQRHPQTRIDCFYQRSESIGSESVDRTLHFHPVDRDLLKQRMVGCKGILIDGGFELLAMAATHGKPLINWLSRPHAESRLLAEEMARLGLSRTCRSFNLEDPGPARRDPGNDRFQEWLSRSGERLTRTFGVLRSRVR